MGGYEAIIGTLEIGILFNTFLYGLVAYQFASYCRVKFNDRPLIRHMVFFLFILDTFHSVSAIYPLWYYTVSNVGKPGIFERAVWPYEFTPLGTALAALVTQLFLGYRILRLTGSKFLYGVVIIMAIVTFVLGVTCSIMAFVINVVSELPRITPLVTTWLSMQVATDVFITITLVITFIRMRDDVGFRRSDSILKHLIRGAVQTGLFAGIFAMGDMIAFIVSPDTNFYGMFAFPMGRIYTNTLMDTLLTRQSLRKKMNPFYEMSRISGPMACQWHSSGIDSTSTPLEVKNLKEVPVDCLPVEREGRSVPVTV